MLPSFQNTAIHNLPVAASYDDLPWTGSCGAVDERSVRLSDKAQVLYCMPEGRGLIESNLQLADVSYWCLKWGGSELCPT